MGSPNPPSKLADLLKGAPRTQPVRVPPRSSVCPVCHQPPRKMGQNVRSTREGGRTASDHRQLAQRVTTGPRAITTNPWYRDRRQIHPISDTTFERLWSIVASGDGEAGGACSFQQALGVLRLHRPPTFGQACDYRPVAWTSVVDPAPFTYHISRSPVSTDQQILFSIVGLRNLRPASPPCEDARAENSTLQISRMGPSRHPPPYTSWP